MSTEDKNAVQTLFDVASIATNVLSEKREGSVIEYSSVCNSRLITTVEDRLTHNEVTSNIMKLVTNLYVGYYMQCVGLMNQVGNINVRQVLDRLNPNRDTIGNGRDRIEQWVAVESTYDYPQFGDYMPAIATEADQKDTQWASEAPNLAMGKIFEVVIENNGCKAVIPARVTLAPISCNQAMFTAMYGHGNQNNTFMNRFRRWQDGELSTIADMIFVNDIISEKAKLLKHDKLKIVEQLEKRRLNNKISTLITQKTSIATASSVSILSKDTIKSIELNNGGRISDAKIRDAIFEKSGLIIMAVVDEMYETVTFYFRGESHSTELTFNECKISSKGNGPNPLEILKAFQSGQVPNI